MYRKYGDIAKAMGVDTTGMSKEEAAQAAVDSVRKLAIDVGIPQTLREIKYSRRGTSKIIKRCII